MTPLGSAIIAALGLHVRVLVLVPALVLSGADIVLVVDLALLVRRRVVKVHVPLPHSAKRRPLLQRMRGAAEPVVEQVHRPRLVQPGAVGDGLAQRRGRAAVGAAVVQPRRRQAAAREVAAQLSRAALATAAAAAGGARAAVGREAAVAVALLTLDLLAAGLLRLGRVGGTGCGGLGSLDLLGGGRCGGGAVVGLGGRGERGGTWGCGRLVGLQAASDGAEAVLLAWRLNRYS